jgi:hypothetical protein
MERGKDLDPKIYEPKHIKEVLTEIKATFPSIFAGFSAQQLIQFSFRGAIMEFEKDQPHYREYLDLRALDEFEDNPNSFKHETKTKCPIIRRCLMATDDVMKQYKRSFNEITGRQLLTGVKNIALFGSEYAATFNEKKHEHASSYDELNLAPLSRPEYGCPGVIGYGVQSSLLFGMYPEMFAHRSQNAVWSLYFITNRKDFGLEDSSEFLMIQPKYNTCEQNYFYPADLFGFYALKLYLLLKQACKKLGIRFDDRYRYIYLSTFTDYVADLHRKDIDVYKRNSEYVENHWH